MKPNRSVFLQTDFFIPILEYVGVKERGVAARGYFFSVPSPRIGSKT